jgi:hypothetical protein
MSKLVARLVLQKPSELPQAHRRNIANWLRRQARFLEKSADKMSTRFTARYFNN